MADLLWLPETPISHRIEYATDILMGLDGLEQRVGLRDVPRQSMDYRLFFSELLQMRRYRGFLFTVLNDPWRVPLWWEVETLTIATATGSDTWVADPALAYVDLEAGDKVYVVAPTGTPAEILTVDTVGAGVITTTTNAANDYPIGSGIYKLQTCRMRDAPTLERFRTGQEYLSVSLDFDEPLPVLGGAGASIATFEATADPGPLAHLAKVPLGNELTSYNFTVFAEDIDYGRHNFDRFSLVDPSAIIERRRYSIRNRADLQYWEKFLETIIGGREPFYTATYRDDLVIDTQPSGAGWDVIKVADESDNVADGFDYVGQWWPESSHKSLRFATDQGEQYKEVTNAVDNADGTLTLTLDSGLVANTVISQISFLERCRLASDSAQFSHEGPRSTVQIAIQTVQQ